MHLHQVFLVALLTFADSKLLAELDAASGVS
jgi:hypothetical protein